MQPNAELLTLTRFGAFQCEWSLMYSTTIVDAPSNRPLTSTPNPCCPWSWRTHLLVHCDRKATQRYIKFAKKYIAASFKTIVLEYMKEDM